MGGLQWVSHALLNFENATSGLNGGLTCAFKVLSGGYERV